MVKTKQLLNYLAMHPYAIVRFHASNKILNIHLDASYLLEANVHSQACGNFFMGWRADPMKPIKLNGAFLPCVQYYTLLLLPLWKPNLVRFSSIANRQQFFNSRSKKWAILSLRHQYIAIIPAPLASQTTPARDNTHTQWKCDSFGLQM
jgi:hypothetical protein